MSVTLKTASFNYFLQSHGLDALKSDRVTTLQVNVGKICNQACHHCHVDAGPNRTETMTREIAEHVVRVLCQHPQLQVVDITGGAPELHAQFRFLVSHARELGRLVTDRCNLTILLEPGHEDLATFLAANHVTIIASLPCYLESNVDKQRGSGVYERSMRALRMLNDLGYGQDGSGLELNLVYNPVGPSLPPPQGSLEADYKRELQARFGIVFNRLFTITNMPIARFRHDLERQGKLDAYMQKLSDAFNPAAVSGVMCRNLISVGHDGRLYDCDFNQMLEMPLLDASCGHIRDFDLLKLEQRRVHTAEHCLGCTAGAGSSCSGAIR